MKRTVYSNFHVNKKVSIITFRFFGMIKDMEVIIKDVLRILAVHEFNSAKPVNLHALTKYLKYTEFRKLTNYCYSYL